jgi:hypothetical protein
MIQNRAAPPPMGGAALRAATAPTRAYGLGPGPHTEQLKQHATTFEDGEK